MIGLTFCFLHVVCSCLTMFSARDNWSCCYERQQRHDQPEPAKERPRVCTFCANYVQRRLIIKDDVMSQLLRDWTTRGCELAKVGCVVSCRSVCICIITTQYDLVRTCHRYDRPSRQFKIVQIQQLRHNIPAESWKVEDNPVTSR